MCGKKRGNLIIILVVSELPSCFSLNTGTIHSNASGASGLTRINPRRLKAVFEAGWSGITPMRTRPQLI